ncbi:MAG: substrate-binding domain-containing protein [Clostridiales bacterium]|nr:substrate-binding domain-containing protein [Clostridiales bacterium]
MKTNKEGAKTFHLARLFAVITMIAMLLSGCSSSDSETKKTKRTKRTKKTETEITETEEPSESETPSQTTTETTEEPTTETTFDTSTIEGYFSAYPEQFPQIDSSTARKPITEGIYTYFMSDYPGDDKLPLCSKTHGAWLNLADNVADLVFLVAPTEEEESHFREVKAKIEMKPYGYDGLGFIVSPNCPVKSLTQEQIRGIYECKITNWKEVGGPDADIHPYFRDEQSGSQRLFEDFLWPDGDAPDFSTMMDHFYFSDDMESITDCVAYDEYAIGYNIMSYLDWAFEDHYIDLVAIDGVAPTTDTFKDGTYPYITTAYVAIRADEPEDSPARMLYDWIGSEKSIEIISENSSLSVDVGESVILNYDS